MRTWLKNLVNQGHEIKWYDSKEEIKSQVEEKNETNGDMSTNDKTETKAEEKSMHWKSLAKFIRENEGISQQAAEDKARELKQSGKEEAYLSDISKKLKDSSKKELRAKLVNVHRTNYQMLLRLIPEILSKSKENAIDGHILVEGDSKKLVYELIPANSKEKGKFLFAINEQDSNNETLIVAVHPKAKKSWVVLRTEGFSAKDGYDLDKDSKDLERQVKVSVEYAEWLDVLIDMGYQVNWYVETKEVDAKVENKPEKEVNPKSKSPKRKYKAGEVQLDDELKAAGLTKRDVNWINKHKQGMILFPTNKGVFNTKDILKDAKKKALPRGKRVSKHGNVYYETRTNRSDDPLTNV